MTTAWRRVIALNVVITPALAALGILGAGCSSGASQSPPTTVTVSSSTLASTKECTAVAAVRGASHISRCSTPTGDVFVTQMRDCSIPEKFSYRATTRQLMVGLSDLTALNQQAVEVGARKVLRSLFSGTLDADKVVVATFTFREGDCVTDLVCWRSAPTDTAFQEGVERFTDVASTIADNLLGASSHEARS